MSFGDYFDDYERGRISRVFRRFYKTSLKVKASLIVMALLLLPLYYYVPWFHGYEVRGGQTVYHAITGDQIAQFMRIASAVMGEAVEEPPIVYFKYIPLAIIIGILIRMGWIAILADLIGLYTLYDTYNLVNQLKEALGDENTDVELGIGFVATAILLLAILAVIADKEEIL